MAVTFKATLKTEKRQSGTQAIRIRVTKDRTPRYYNLGLAVRKADWNPKATEEKENWIRTSHHEHGQHNAAIKASIARLRAIALESPHLEPEEVIAKYKSGDEPEEGPCFLELFSREIKRVAQAGNPRTAARRTSIYGKMKEYAGGSLPMASLDVAYMRDYITHLQTHHGNSQETIKKELQVLSSLAKLAVQEGLMPYAENPFPHLTIKSKPKKKDRLTVDQLETFRTVALPPEKPRMADVRHCFMLQFYLHGARIGDILELRWQDVKEDRVEYVMRKTGKVKSIPRIERLNEILGHYKGKKNTFVLPFLDDALVQAYDEKLPAKLRREANALLLEEIKRKTAFINRYLKEIAKLAKIEVNISTHVARHTFSDIARKKIRDVHTLKNMLAHESVKTTEVYLSAFDQEDVDEASAAIYGA